MQEIEVEGSSIVPPQLDTNIQSSCGCCPQQSSKGANSLLGFLFLQRLHHLQCVMNSWFCINRSDSKACLPHWFISNITCIKMPSTMHLQQCPHQSLNSKSCWSISASNYSLTYQNLSQSCIFWEHPASKLLLCFVVHLLCSNLLTSRIDAIYLYSKGRIDRKTCFILAILSCRRDPEASNLRCS
jgi:hypothetical protein